jgi:hypothetical protein
VAQQPMKKPRKCADPKKPISAEVNISARPASASKGPSTPDPGYTKATDRKRAAKDMSVRMKPAFQTTLTPLCGGNHA